MTLGGPLDPAMPDATPGRFITGTEDVTFALNSTEAGLLSLLIRSPSLLHVPSPSLTLGCLLPPQASSSGSLPSTLARLSNPCRCLAVPSPPSTVTAVCPWLPLTVSLTGPGLCGLFSTCLWTPTFISPAHPQAFTVYLGAASLSHSFLRYQGAVGRAGFMGDRPKIESPPNSFVTLGKTLNLSGPHCAQL